MTGIAAPKGNCPPPRVMGMPERVDVDVTSRCNLRCRYCYFFDGDHGGYGDLPAADWLAFFDECGEARVMAVTLAGGEPFVRPDLGELIDAIVRNRMRFSVLSNGTLIDDGTAALLARTGRCDAVQVSVDGSRPEVHDGFRGAGSFERAVRGIRSLQSHGVPVTVRTTIHRLNARDLEKTARFLLEDLGLASFSTNSAGYLGTCRRFPGEILLDVHERTRAMGALLRLEERYPGRVGAQAGPLAEAWAWEGMEIARAAGAPPFGGGGRLTGCGCSFRSLAVRSDGTYVPCTMLSGIELGRIGEDALLDVWRNHPSLATLRSRRRIPLSTFTECRDCGYLPYCTGNCPGLARSLTGEIDRPSPDACLRRFLAAGGVLPARTAGLPR